MDDLKARFDAPFWGVVVLLALAIGWGSITFLAFSSADRLIELSAAVPGLT
jgi:hypothetical protein